MRVGTEASESEVKHIVMGLRAGSIVKRWAPRSVTESIARLLSWKSSKSHPASKPAAKSESNSPTQCGRTWVERPSFFALRRAALLALIRTGVC